ncbi:MAG TPA: ATP-binding protein [Chthoniobacterales bacterium]
MSFPSRFMLAAAMNPCPCGLSHCDWSPVPAMLAS